MSIMFISLKYHTNLAKVILDKAAWRSHRCLLCTLWYHQSIPFNFLKECIFLKVSSLINVDGPIMDN